MPDNVAYDEDDWYLTADLPAGLRASAFRYRAVLTHDLGFFPGLNLPLASGVAQPFGSAQVRIDLSRAERLPWFALGIATYVVDLYGVDPTTEQEVNRTQYELVVLKRPVGSIAGRSAATLGYIGPYMTGAPWDFAVYIPSLLTYPGYTFDYSLDGPPSPLNDWSVG